ncbi:MAG: response regulator [Bdellovibrionales bacterium]
MVALSKIRVLVVDDNHELLETYEALLSTYGLTVGIARNGAEAWELLQLREIDIVLTDIRMPVMDGVELLKRIRQRNSEKPCVLLTSGYSDHPVEDFYALGANGFLEKPVGASSIRDLISRGTLEREDLWKSPAKLAATSKLNVQVQSFGGLEKSPALKFGSGGFCLYQDRPILSPGVSIDFSIGFDSVNSFGPIEGAGIVQWVRPDGTGERPAAIGVEIRYLTDACRAPVCQWIRQHQFPSFIPSA